MRVGGGRRVAEDVVEQATGARNAIRDFAQGGEGASCPCGTGEHVFASYGGGRTDRRHFRHRWRRGQEMPALKACFAFLILQAALQVAGGAARPGRGHGGGGADGRPGAGPGVLDPL